MRDLVGFLGQRLVVEGFGGVGVEAEVELILPAEIEAGAGHRVVAQLRGGMALGEVSPGGQLREVPTTPPLADGEFGNFVGLAKRKPPTGSALRVYEEADCATPIRPTGYSSIRATLAAPISETELRCVNAV
jgi:hypothetical protein